MTGLKPHTIRLVKEAAASGLTVTEAAVALDMSRVTVAKYAIELGLDFKRGGRVRKVKPIRPHSEKWATLRKRHDDRFPTMATLYREGYTLQQIGEQFGVTRERVRQILSKYGDMSAKDGGKHATAVAKKERRARLLDGRCIAKHGCTREQLAILIEIGRRMQAAGRGLYQTPVYAFRQQRQSAKNRGIGWDLTLWQWWSIWERSGKWENRGRGGTCYVMARHGDTGPYAAWNVDIIPTVKNVHEANNKSGLPCGVRRANSREYEAVRTIGGKQLKLGRFPTPELARAAYIAAGAA